MYNILQYCPNDGPVLCVIDAKNGLSDFLFDNGVRILASALTFREVRGFILNNTSHEEITYEDFFGRVISNTNHESEPSRAWKGKYFNPWDNKLDPKYPPN